ncbi:MAG: AAA family ATPase [Candidatus Sericytochromatia bacterium]|nr:AAA family ATPase [Candidatus Tanganyikabacteria bacterium]
MTPGALFCLGCGKAAESGDFSLVGLDRKTRALGQPGEDSAAKAGARRRVVTILFADVSGYTTLSESLDPEIVADLMNELFATITEPIFRFGGIVDKYIGDAVMAVFGLPLSREDDAVRSIHAGLEMQRLMHRFAKDRKAELGVDLRIRVGLNTGLVLAGAIGRAESKTQTVTGDTVNLAQRMEGLAEPGEVFISEYTQRQARDAFVFESRGNVQVKGRKTPVSAYRVVRAQGEGAGTGLAPLFGRDAELARLGRLWSLVQAGKAKSAYVRGDSGIGKTALLRRAFGGELRAAASATGPEAAARQQIMVWLTCHEYQKSEPFALLIYILKHLLGLPEQAARPEEVETVLSRECLLPAEDSAGSAALQWLLAGAETPAIVALAPEQRKGLVFRAMIDVIVARAQKEALLLVIDDLQWIDDLTAEWLQQLFWVVEGRTIRLLLCAAYRPGRRVIPKPQSEYTEIDLDRLPDDAAIEYFNHVLGRELAGVFPADRVQRWLAQANGHPALIRATAEHTRDLGLDAESHDYILPLSVMQLFMAKIDAAKISDAAIRALNAAAVLGGLASTRRISAITEDPDTPAAMAELFEAKILRRGPTDGAVAFEDGLFALATYERILMNDRRRLHAKAAAVLGADGLHPAVLAEHIERVGDPAQATMALLVAAEHALRTSAPFLALELVEEAERLRESANQQDLPGDLDRRVALLVADAKAAQSDLEGAIKAVTTAAAMSETAEAPLLLAKKAEFLGRLGRHLEANEVCAAALAMFPARDAIGYGLVQAIRVDSINQLGEHKNALAIAEEALILAEHYPPSVQGRLLGSRGRAMRELGDLEGARDTLLQALDVHQAARDDYQAAILLGQLGSLYRQIGNLETARRALGKGLQLVAALGERRVASNLLLHLGEVHLELGEVDKSSECFEMALRDYRRVGDRLGEGLALWKLGDLGRRVGSPLAEPNLLQAIMVLEDLDAKSHLDGAYQSLALLHIAKGSKLAALQYLRLSSQHARESGRFAVDGVNLRLLAEVCRDLGREDALEWATRSVGLLSALAPSKELLLSCALLAKILAARQLLPQAWEAMRTAQGVLERLGGEEERLMLEELAARLGPPAPQPARPET